MIGRSLSPDQAVFSQFSESALAPRHPSIGQEGGVCWDSDRRCVETDAMAWDHWDTIPQVQDGLQCVPKSIETLCQNRGAVSDHSKYKFLYRHGWNVYELGYSGLLPYICFTIYMFLKIRAKRFFSYYHIYMVFIKVFLIRCGFRVTTI